MTPPPGTPETDSVFTTPVRCQYDNNTGTPETDSVFTTPVRCQYDNTTGTPETYYYHNTCKVSV